jgi:transcription termination factor Rho
VTAQALEQSVLESKDKAQLIAIAEALGVKANSRNKKADIIDQILTKTGGSSDSARSNGAPAAPSAPATGAEPRTSHASSSAPSAPSVVTEPADEPKAEWEIALDDGGDDRSSDSSNGGGRSHRQSTSGVSTSARGRTSDARIGAAPSDAPSDAASDASPDSRSGTSSGDDRRASGGASDDPNQGEARSGDRRPDEQQPGEQQPGDQQRGEQKSDRVDRSGGDRQNRQNNNNNNQNNQGDGDGSRKRRRRRRKGRGGQDGPQGEDRDLLEDDDEQQQPTSNEPVRVEGYLDMRDEGYGFLRVNNYLASKSDSYIPVKLSRQYGLRKGDHVAGMSRPAGRNEKNPAMLEILSVNGRPPEQAKKRPRFEDLTALFPDSRLRLEDPSDPTNMVARIVDLVSPIGKGQRGLIVSPPKAGKTTIMKTIVASVEKNNPECKTIVLLIDERPEEVTEFRRSVQGEVIASTFDKPSDQHTQIAEMALEKAKRMVEYGEDVVIILDGITRLSRAYNLAAPASGRILSGGIDAGALYPPKRFFGAARNVEEGGSLTILATALVETNSRMDEAVFEEFKGTGNMELRLDRRLAERRIYPAIDVDASSTRHEELLFDRKQLQMVWKLRRVLSGLAADGNAAPGLELLVDRLKTFRTNDEFLTEIAKQPGM